MCLITVIMLISDPSFKWVNLCVFFLPLVVPCGLEGESIRKECQAGARDSPWTVGAASEPWRWSSTGTGQASFTTLVCAARNVWEIQCSLARRDVSDTGNGTIPVGKDRLLEVFEGPEKIVKQKIVLFCFVFYFEIHYLKNQFPVIFISTFHRWVLVTAFTNCSFFVFIPPVRYF